MLALGSSPEVLTSVAAKMDNGVYPLADCERRGHVCNIGLHECLALRRCKRLLIGKLQLYLPGIASELCLQYFLLHL